MLVFSQFTSLLAIVKKRLKAEKIDFLYIDGKTKNRQALVEEFQSGAGPAGFPDQPEGGRRRSEFDCRAERLPA